MVVVVAFDGGAVWSGACILQKGTLAIQGIFSVYGVLRFVRVDALIKIINDILSMQRAGCLPGTSYRFEHKAHPADPCT